MGSPLAPSHPIGYTVTQAFGKADVGVQDLLSGVAGVLSSSGAPGVSSHNFQPFSPRNIKREEKYQRIRVTARSVRRAQGDWQVGHLFLSRAQK